MGEDTDITRRDALKATGGLVGGLAVGNAVVGSVTAQESYYRYDAVRVRLVDADARPPRFHTVERALYLTEPSLADCDADDPCAIDVLDYSVADDDDDNDDDRDDDDNDNGDDDNGDDDRGCPGFASVTLLCNAGSASEGVVLTGLIPDVLSEYADRGFDFVVSLAPSDATSVEDPETVSSPCPTASDDSSDDDGGDDDDDDDGNDTGVDDDSDDDSDGGGDNDDGDDDSGDDDTGSDDNGDDDGSDDDTGGDDDADDN